MLIRALLDFPSKVLRKSRALTTQYQIAFDPEIVPPLDLMLQEGIDVLEEWFRWGNEWSMLLRFYGNIKSESSILEIGCGLGRTAFPLRYILSSKGSYDGFEICQNKVDFLNHTFHRQYPNFRFGCADVHNTFYNPLGTVKPGEYRFPYDDATFDIVYAASVFTHMLPETTAHYFCEAARVLKPGGRALFSFFFFDSYLKNHPRPHGFSRPAFNFDYPYGNYGDLFAIAVPGNPERMTAYRLQLLEHFAAKAKLDMAVEPVRGLWSGTIDASMGAQDLLVLAKSA